MLMFVSLRAWATQAPAVQRLVEDVLFQPWSYYSQRKRLYGIYAKSWTGTSWVGGFVPQVVHGNTHDGLQQLADVGSTPYMVFLESDKTQVYPRTFVYVESWNGTNWVLTGSGALNTYASSNTTATSVSITSDGTAPYVAWAEYTTQYAGPATVDTPDESGWNREPGGRHGGNQPGLRYQYLYYCRTAAARKLHSGGCPTRDYCRFGGSL